MANRGIEILIQHILSFREGEFLKRQPNIGRMYTDITLKMVQADEMARKHFNRCTGESIIKEMSF